MKRILHIFNLKKMSFYKNALSLEDGVNTALKVTECLDPLFLIHVDHYVHDGDLESLAL